jgi:hypothetical protein
MTMLLLTFLSVQLRRVYEINGTARALGARLEPFACAYRRCYPLRTVSGALAEWTFVSGDDGGVGQCY